VQRKVSTYKLLNGMCVLGGDNNAGLACLSCFRRHLDRLLLEKIKADSVRGEVVVAPSGRQHHPIRVYWILVVIRNGENGSASYQRSAAAKLRPTNTGVTDNTETFNRKRDSVVPKR
jgi:hypothetical protein